MGKSEKAHDLKKEKTTEISPFFPLSQLREETLSGCFVFGWKKAHLFVR